MSVTLPSLNEVHRRTASTLEDAIKAEAMRRANLAEPVIKVEVDAPYYPGPIVAIAHGRQARRAMTVCAVAGWRRGSVHLLLMLDGSRNWDYSDHAHPTSYGRHKPRWIDPSYEHLTDLHVENNGEMTLVTAVNFADWWGLELIPFDEAADLAHTHLPSLG